MARCGEIGDGWLDGGWAGGSWAGAGQKLGRRRGDNLGTATQTTDWHLEMETSSVALHLGTSRNDTFLCIIRVYFRYLYISFVDII